MTTRLEAPLTEATVRELELGETVYIDGIVYTLRDAQHIRAEEYLDAGKDLPVDLTDQIVYHCAPAYRETADGYEILAAGPTTSERQNFFAPRMIQELGVRAIAGKGGMDAATRTAMTEQGCVYLTVPSVSAMIVEAITAVENRYWPDLHAESIWVFRMDGFGPLTVTIDAHGNDRREETGDESLGTNYTV